MVQQEADKHVLRSFKRRLWQPPRAHGEVEEDRQVTFLELFYDLVYVVVIATLASQLAHDITWRAFAEFVVFFGLIWIAWLNGSMFHDLHGRNDVRTRTFTFIQMGLIGLLAVYANDHTEEVSGFAIVYALLFALFGWLWWGVRRQDEEVYRAVTTRYLGFILATAGAVVASTFVGEDGQLVIYAVVVIGWIGVVVFTTGASSALMGDLRTINESTVERFGLFTIIVLGEVVVGVVEGLIESTRDASTMATGMLALVIGFGLWWNYFDTTGRRLPRNSTRSMQVWVVAQLPLTMAIAAAGASMVSLIEHGSDSHSPEGTAWLLVASVSIGLTALALVGRTLLIFDQFRSVYHPGSIFMLIVAAALPLLALWNPAPVVLTSLLVVALMAVWLFPVTRWLASEESGEDPLRF